MFPRVVELTATGDGQVWPLTTAEEWIGRDESQSTIALADDPFLSLRHARLFADSCGQWHIEDRESLNGVWVRIHDMHVESSGYFMIGEQRIALKVL